MKTMIVLIAALAALSGCSRAAARADARTDGYAPNASPILTSRSDCLSSGGIWNDKFKICEPPSSRK